VTIRTRRRLWGIGAVLVCWSLAAGASTPRFWLVSTQADMLKGEVDGLAVDDTGRLVLGPGVTPVLETTAPFVWCLAAGPGGAVFAGAGNDGQVWRIDPHGQSAVFFKAPELEVHAIVAARDGSLFVASSPDGKVYRVDQKGQATAYFDPADKYIWSMALDPEGRLYVGTGDKGLIYRVTAAGQGEVFYKTNTKNVTALAFGADGQLLAGTDSPGRLLRIDATRHAFALFDSPFREVRAIRVVNADHLYVAAVNGKAGGDGDAGASAAPAAEPSRTSTAGVTTEIMSVTIIDTASASKSAAPPASKPAEKSSSKGAIYLIGAAGRQELVWESREDVPFDLAVESNALGDVVSVATGNGGKIFRVGGNPTHTTLMTRLSAQQVTAMLSVGKVQYLATANPGKVFASTGERRSSGEYVSEVKDAGMAATWGTLSWRAVQKNGARVQVMTRAGNTSEPDDTWSPWSPAYQHAGGDTITSPSARYIQWKATLAAAPDATGPELRSVKLGYQQRNARPRVTAVTVMPAGTVYQKQFPTGDPDIAGLPESLADEKTPLYSLPLGSPQSGQYGRRLYQKGLQAFTWKAEDDNDDRLTFDVFYRTIDAADWKALRLGLTESILTWDTTSVPDGTYLIKIQASDASSNPHGSAQLGELESDAFDIDNTPPEISVVSVTRDTSSGGPLDAAIIEVRDAHSPIGTVEISEDGARWQTLFPDDGIADRQVERYTIKREPGKLGRVVIRAADTLNNLATRTIEERR